MWKEITEQTFLALANTRISYIGIYELFGLIDDNLLDCEGIVVCFPDRRVLIKSKAVGEDDCTFVYYEFNQNFAGRKILSKTEEPISFIRKESPELLRFQIGERPLLVTADDTSIVTVGLSHWGINEEWIKYENHMLLNDN